MINNNNALEINVLLFDSGRCRTLQIYNLYLMFYSKYKLIQHTVLSQFQNCMSDLLLSGKFHYDSQSLKCYIAAFNHMSPTLQRDGANKKGKNY